MINWKPQPPPFTENKIHLFKQAIKTASFIHQIGETDALRCPSKEVDIFVIKNKEIQRKIKYIKSYLLKYRKLTGHGRGLSAVQVGIPERILVIYTPEKLLTIINPQITNSSNKKLKYSEMCMSAYPIIAPVIRPAWIEFEYFDEEGRKQHWQTKVDTLQNKIFNRVFQHEIDHINGIINIDRVESPKELILDSDPHFYDTVTFEQV